MNTPPLLNLDDLMLNAGNDNALAKELVSMGMQRIKETIPDLISTSGSEEWMDFAQHIHKLRPMLSFCGVKALNKSLLTMEKNIKEQTGKTPNTSEVQEIVTTLETAYSELDVYLKQQ